MPLLRFAWYGARRGGLRTTYLEEVRTLHGGETLDLPGAPRVIAAPGHSPGSVAYHVAAVDAVFVGDALTTGPHVLPEPRDLSLRTSSPRIQSWPSASLANIEAAGARWVLPGHGVAWDGGAAEAVRRVRAGA